MKPHRKAWGPIKLKHIPVYQNGGLFTSSEDLCKSVPDAVIIKAPSEPKIQFLLIDLWGMKIKNNVGSHGSC